MLKSTSASSPGDCAQSSCDTLGGHSIRSIGPNFFRSDYYTSRRPTDDDLANRLQHSPVGSAHDSTLRVKAERVWGYSAQFASFAVALITTTSTQMKASRTEQLGWALRKFATTALETVVLARREGTQLNLCLSKTLGKARR